MKSVDEIYRPFPDDERDPPGKATCPSKPRPPSLWPLIVSIVLVIGFCLGVGALTWCPMGLSHDNRARHLIDNLTQAIKVYGFDHDAFPPGDGVGSRRLAKCLTAPIRCARYVEVPPGMLDRDGDLVTERGKKIHYRRPGVHHPDSFDLWTEDHRGRPDGINNWK